MGRVGVHAGPRAWGQLVPHRLPGMVGISKILDTARDTIPYCCCHTDQALALSQTMISSIISASIALHISRAALGGWGCCPAASAWLFLLFFLSFGWNKDPSALPDKFLFLQQQIPAHGKLSGKLHFMWAATEFVHSIFTELPPCKNCGSRYLAEQLKCGRTLFLSVRPHVGVFISSSPCVKCLHFPALPGIMLLYSEVYLYGSGFAPYFFLHSGLLELVHLVSCSGCW